jgi:hypothetical protein
VLNLAGADMKKTAAIVVAAACVAWASTAQAAVPTEASIKAEIAAENPNMDLDAFRIVYTGPIGPLRDGAVVAAFTTVIHGGNLRDQTFGVFVEKAGKAVELPIRPLPTGQIDRVAVARDRVRVHWMSFKPSDPQCCPSQPHSEIYIVGRTDVTGSAS